MRIRNPDAFATKKIACCWKRKGELNQVFVKIKKQKEKLKI
jgi:hypothetical protein